jgi:hypothetical protein
MTRAAIGKIAGSSAPREDTRPNMRGALTVEQDLPAGTKLWLAAWSRQIAGADYISISAEISIGGLRTRFVSTRRCRHNTGNFVDWTRLPRRNFRNDR